MRLRITLQVDCPTTIPLNYGYPLSGAIYNFLAQSDADYAHFLHSEGYAPHGTGSKGTTGMPRHFKLFTFSQLRAERSRVQGEHLHLLPGTIEWLVASPVEKFLREFASGLLSGGTLRVASQALPISQVETLPAPQFSATTAFRCLSPIVVAVTEEQNGKRWARYLRPKDPAFSERVRLNLIAKHCALHGAPPLSDELALQFDNDHLAKNKGTKLVTYKDIRIVGA